ncbi:MAG: hypothetical protein QOG91_394 [Candidatus Parcubacteria bacterium]|nr:hypothetical protein [Candidatus Parcubacteria bacterium]
MKFRKEQIRLGFLITVVGLLWWLVIAFPFPKHADKSLSLFTSDPAERRVISAAVQTPISEGACPVAIYEFRDGRHHWSGSGVCYSNANGATLLMTVAHIFVKRDQPASFVVRKLTPHETRPTWCMKRIIKAGKQWGKNTDVAACEVVPLTFPLPQIRCDVDAAKADPALTRLYTFDEAIAIGLTNVGRKTLTSLVSGERVALCGIVPEPDFESWYYLTDSTIGFGDGGTPYIDEKGSLYLAHGSVSSELSSETAKQFKLTVRTPGLVLGPVGVRKD